MKILLLAATVVATGLVVTFDANAAAPGPSYSFQRTGAVSPTFVEVRQEQPWGFRHVR